MTQAIAAYPLGHMILSGGCFAWATVTVVHELGPDARQSTEFAHCETEEASDASVQAERNRRTASELGLGALAQILVATAPVVKSRASNEQGANRSTKRQDRYGSSSVCQREPINISQVTASEHFSGVCHETKSDWSTERSIHRYSIQSAARWRRFAFSAWSENNGALAPPAECKRIRPRV